MSARAPFRQHDLARALKAMAHAGIAIAGVRLDGDGATILTTTASESLLKPEMVEAAGVFARLNELYGPEERDGQD
ncbi:hypothetical protein [Methylocystis parvus]|uniref:hypothetical protein n=1 Tax=Methylocystis parvus TaxID=134 RepID=UPI003C75E818